jgi:hypothetical protein
VGSQVNDPPADPRWVNRLQEEEEGTSSACYPSDDIFASLNAGRNQIHTAPKLDRLTSGYTKAAGPGREYATKFGVSGHRRKAVETLSPDQVSMRRHYVSLLEPVIHEDADSAHARTHPSLTIHVCAHPAAHGFGPAGFGTDSSRLSTKKSNSS